MAESFVSYTGDGSTNLFSIPFDYLDNTHVTALVDDVLTNITFPTVSQAEFDVAPSNGATVVIKRTTPRTVREVVWQNAANLSAGDLNLSGLQLLFITQEAFDSVGTTSEDAIAAGLARNAAEIAETNAEIAEASAQAILSQMQILEDDFEDRYLGPKASDPTTDNDGDPLETGALYFKNTVTKGMKFYDASTGLWEYVTTPTTVADRSLTGVKLALLTVLGENIADATIAGTKLINGAISYAKIAGGSIATVAQLAAGSASRLVSASNLRTFLNDYGFGFSQTWVTETANRDFGTTYTNNSNKTIFVSVTGTGQTFTNRFISILVNNTEMAREQTSLNSDGALAGNVCVPVPSGATYRVNTTDTTMTYWREFK